MKRTRLLQISTIFMLAVFLSGVFFPDPAFVVGLAPGERLMRTKLRIGGGDIYMVDSSVDADDWQLEHISGGGTKLLPQIDDLIFPKSIDIDLADSQMLMYGMASDQYDDEMFINNTVNTGTKIEETSGNTDPTETTAFSIGKDFGYGKVTIADNADGDTYAGYSYTMDVFYDEDNDGVKDTGEYGYLPDFDETCYIYIAMKGDWTNISTSAGDQVAEVDLYFTTSGSDLEIEAHVTADADGNTGWTNFDDGSADSKATFLYANADATFVSFLFDLPTMDQYDEDDYSTIKGLDKIVYKILGRGAESTAEMWVYNVVFLKQSDVWNYGTDKRPALTEEGQLDVDDDFIPSYTAASESDGGMYLNAADDIDFPVTAVTESSSTTSAYSSLINTDDQLLDGDIVPLNWRKLKFESDQTGSNKEDDYNLELLPTTYKPEIIKTHPDGGVEVRETFTFDLSGMDDIKTSASLLTWDSSTDKMYVQDYIQYSQMASDIWDSKDPADLVVAATEGLANTYDATDDLKSAWSGETDQVYIQYVLVKQPDTTTGDILKHVRHVRYDAAYVKDLSVKPQEGGPFWQQKVATPAVIAIGLGALGALIFGIIKLRGRKRR